MTRVELKGADKDSYMLEYDWPLGKYVWTKPTQS